MTPTTNPVVAALPADGWSAGIRVEEGVDYNLPLVGWLVYADGTVRPICIDHHGQQKDPTTLPNFSRLWSA
ncbi:hypothetical protein ACPCBX_13640 [Streptomyces tuirus]|uniref:Uncharacterized protein n=1 Tax=Streptomyces tuirus TaxID=68278 RepID=A0A7G1NF20_9ACTN|nr:hypothetical protein [Streptomyces tuirus]BCL20300.1 hypothetical protein GCM10017668_21430 [Streptomyces tuirus]